MEQPIWGAAILESLDRYDDPELVTYRQDLQEMLSKMRLFSLHQGDPETAARLRDFRFRFVDAASSLHR